VEAGKVTRKLSAIFAADMVGYSRLMATDEEGTIARQKTHSQELIDPKISEYGGRIVKLMGDGMLVEFASVVDAVRCAVEVQEGFAEREHDVPFDLRIRYRTGINLGDIVIDGDDILGDGVNVAARLEGLAPPGGICISDVVHQSVVGKIDMVFEDLGEQHFKNIDRPVKAFALNFGADNGVTEPAAEATEAAQLALPDKPSIAVLAFTNMSGDPEQEYFGDGIAEDIITSLSKISSLFVIARNSAFAYKNQTTDIREVAKDLGVQYVLEGSVRKGGNRLRITAQLVEATTGNHLWAERYDRDLEDIFDIQDEITQEITTALQVQLTEGEQVRLRRRQTTSLAAWDLYVRARTNFFKLTPEALVQTREQLDRALELDPEFTAPWSLLAWVHHAEGGLGWSASSDASFEAGANAALKALEIDDANGDALSILGAIRTHQRRYDEGEEAGRKAIDLSPSTSDAYVQYARLMNLTGRAEQAKILIEKAMRLCPIYPALYLSQLALSYRMLGLYEQAIAANLEVLSRTPENAFSDLRLAACYMETGREEEARFHIREALRKNPQYTLAQVRVVEPHRDEGDMSRYLDSLRLAGLPE
jgi:adenylate cyclase